MLGILTFLDHLLRDAGFSNIHSFDEGVIGVFGMVWLLFWYYKQERFKE
jgi:hypothetical protein